MSIRRTHRKAPYPAFTVYLLCATTVFDSGTHESNPWRNKLEVSCVYQLSGS